MKSTITLTAFCFILFYGKVALAQEYFKVEPTFNCNCGEFTKSLSDLKTYTDSEVNVFFNKLAKESQMEFRYPQGGCQQRAEMMHKLLKDSGIEHAKVWIFAPVNLEHNETTHLEIHDKNQLASNNTIKWGYHVAPCVLRKIDNKVDTLVIDPSIRINSPIILNDWFKAMKNSDVSKYTFLDSKYYFFNTQNNGNSPVINGYFYTYEPAEGWVTMYDNATVERELAVNDVAMYLKEKLDNGYQDQNNEIRTLLGSVENLISLYAAQQRCNNLKGISMRQLLQNHSKLINESMKFYNERVNFWMKK